MIIARQSFKSFLKFNRLITFPSAIKYNAFDKHILTSNRAYFSDLNKKLTKEEMDQLKKAAQEFEKIHVSDIVDLQKIEDWSQIIQNTKKPLLIDFYADWCMPCKKLTPKLQERVIKAEGKIKLVKINIDKFGNIANVFQIKSVPTVFVVYQQKIYDSFSGQISDQMLDKVLQNLNNLSSIGKDEEQVVKALQQVQNMLKDQQFESVVKLLTELKFNKVKIQYKYVRDIFLSYSYSKLGKISHLKAVVEEMKKNEAFYTGKPEFNELYLELVRQTQVIEKELKENDKFEEWRIKMKSQPQNLGLKFQAAQFFKQNQLIEQSLHILVQIVKQNKDWQQKKANKKVLLILKELGNASPITLKYRKIFQRALH